MTIEAKIIADSISPAGKRITTMQLRYPRFIHSEFMTHRVFSRNASSSRAIPVERMIEDLRRDPAMPVYWGAKQKGMQAGAELDAEAINLCRSIWLDGMEDAIIHANLLLKNGLHKQIANRILEPWAHINVVVTATEWQNFFALRAHKDAQPEIRELALAMFNAMAGSQPEHLEPGEWHLPYADGPEIDLSTPEAVEIAKKVSAARCARVSYLTHDGRQTTVEEDLALFQRLLVDTPLHASPAEHQATPDSYDQRDAMLSRAAAGQYADGLSDYSKEFSWLPNWGNPEFHGNFVGWVQHRKLLDNEFVPD